MFMQETYFTDEQKTYLKRLLNVTESEFQRFNDAVTPAIYYASLTDLPEKEKKAILQKARDTGEKFRDQLEEGSFLWNTLWFSQDGFEQLLALNKLIEKLNVPINEGHSKYKPLAAAVGVSMKKVNLEVSGSYKSNTIEIIEICIEAAGLKESGNLRELTHIAKKAAENISSKFP
jgi:hypothetical protein